MIKIRNQKTIRILDKFTYSHFYWDITGFMLFSYLIIIQWNNLQDYMRLTYAFYLAMCLHQLEEYRLPGGFVFGFNQVRGSKIPERYPGNRLSASFVDIFFQIAAGCIIAFHCTPFWACFFAGFALLEVAMHFVFGIITYRKLKNKGKQTIYFPGNITAWFLFFPIGLAIFHETFNHGLMDTHTLLSVLTTILLYVGVLVLGPYCLLIDKNSPFMYRGDTIKGYFRKYE